MIAMERGRKVRGVLSALTLVGVVGTVSPALAQNATKKAAGRTAVPAQTPAPAAPPSQPVYDPTKPGQLQVKAVALPVNPTDPIAIINNDVITRQQLADECVVRK